MSKQQQLVFVLGTGRCGTTSLAYLLDKQPGVRCMHEGTVPDNTRNRVIPGRFHLPWVMPKDPAKAVANRICILSNKFDKARIVGDSAMYYLNYVETILDTWPDARFISIKRNLRDTVSSYLSWLDHFQTGRDHWQADRSRVETPDKNWDPVYPKYEVNSRREGIERYWHDYYARTQQLVKTHPDNVRQWWMSDLNDDDSLRDMLEFAGVPIARQQRVAVKKNARKKP